MVAFTGSELQDQWTRPGPKASGSLLEEQIPGLTGAGGYAPRHCGAAMEWSTPPMRTVAAYSYDVGEDFADLPEVWRCSCGFQLDSWADGVNTAGMLADISRL